MSLEMFPTYPKVRTEQLSAVEWDKFPALITLIRSLAGQGINDSSVVNVRGMGARGDGLADDTEPLQRAINLGAANGLPVFIPPGTYRTGMLTLPSGTTLIGASPAETKLTGSGAVLFIPRGNENITIVNLGMESGGSDSAVLIGAFSTGPEKNRNISIRNCKIAINLTNGSKHPIAAYSHHENLTIEECEIVGGGGILIDNPISVVIRGNRVVSYSNGITTRAYDPNLYDHVVVEGNYIEAQRMPIEIWGGGGPGTRYVVVRKNIVTCKSPGLTENFGISVVVGEKGLIEGNIVRAEVPSSYGMEVGINSVVQGNTIEGPFGVGICLGGSHTKTVVAKNRIVGATTGIGFVNNGQKRNVHIIGNVIDADNGIASEGIPQGPATVEGNIITLELNPRHTNTTLHGIVISSTDEPWTIIGNTLVCRGDSIPSGAQWYAIRNNDANSVGHKIIGNLIKYEGAATSFGKFWHANAGTPSIDNSVFIGNTLVKIADAGTGTGDYKAFGNTFMGTVPDNAGTLFN